MVIERTCAKTYEIDDSYLKEYVDFILQTGIEPDFYTFIEWFSDIYDLEDMEIDNYSEWNSVNGIYDINIEFKNIIENYYND